MKTKIELHSENITNNLAIKIGFYLETWNGYRDVVAIDDEGNAKIVDSWETPYTLRDEHKIVEAYLQFAEYFKNDNQIKQAI